MQEQIQNQIKDAMRARDQVRLTTLRGVLSSFTNELVALKRTPQDKLSDIEAVAVIKRLGKQRKDSIEQFKKAGRLELAENERAELKILEEFLPTQMGEEEIRKIVQTLRQAQGDNANSIIEDKGKFIGLVMKEVAGQADGNVVKGIVEELLS